MKSYKEYYQECVGNYTKLNIPPILNPWTFGLEYNGELTGVRKPNQYMEWIDMVNADIDDRIAKGQTIVDAEGIAVKIKDAVNLKGANFLAEFFTSELRDSLYESHCFVDHVHPYYLQKVDVEENSSWMWHYDNTAPGQLKLMIYLNDTTKENGAMCILKDKRTETWDAPLIESSRVDPKTVERPVYPKTRVPKQKIENMLASGNYEEHYCEGPKGTFIIFNPNIYHKGTIPTVEPGRRCIIFMFRPYHAELTHHFGPQLTKGWEGRQNAKGYKYEI